jgi:hypothetical protein
MGTEAGKKVKPAELVVWGAHQLTHTHTHTKQTTVQEENRTTPLRGCKRQKGFDLKNLHPESPSSLRYHVSPTKLAGRIGLEPRFEPCFFFHSSTEPVGSNYTHNSIDATAQCGKEVCNSASLDSEDESSNNSRGSTRAS